MLTITEKTTIISIQLINQFNSSKTIPAPTNQLLIEAFVYKSNN